MRSWIVPILLSAACGQPVPTAAAPAVPDAGSADASAPPEAARFEAEAAASGPRLWLEGSVVAEHAAIEVWGAALGPVFGLAGRVAFDDAHLALDGAEVEPEVIDAGAVRFAAPRGAAVAFAVTRAGAALGDVEVDAPVRLARLSFSAHAAGRSALRFERTVVRRSDGAYVDFAARGGDVITLGGAR